MTILHGIQKQLAENGRIRIGDTAETDGGGTRPTKLDTFRFTSHSQDFIEAIAARWGGEIDRWDAPDGSRQWEVVSEATALEVLLPPGEIMSQFWESWSRAGCARRCDGRTELLNMTPCICPLDDQDKMQSAKPGTYCKPMTRLRVILPEIRGLGIWLLTSGGYYAAVELGGLNDTLEAIRRQLGDDASAKLTIPATLRLEQREVRKPGQQVKRFPVPVVDLHVSFRQVTSGATGILNAPGGTGELGPVPRATQRAELPAGQVPTPPSGDAAAWNEPKVDWRRAAAESGIGGNRALKIARELAQENGFALPTQVGDLDSLDEHLADLLISRLEAEAVNA